MKGYTGKIAVINLKEKRVEELFLEDEIAQKFIGGRGLGAYLLYQYRQNNIDPFSMKNPLIIASGPLNGTKTPLASKIGFFFYSPQTGFFGESYVGGSMPKYPKWIGYDAIIIKNGFDTPGLIIMTEEGVEFRNAKELWGLGSVKTDEILRKEFGKKATVVSIGPAGENQVRFASINVDRWRQAGRTGGGAVMGVKKIKAMVFISEENWLDSAEPNKFQDLLSNVLEKFRTDEGVKRLREYGTSAMATLANNMGFFPSLYWNYGFLEKWEDISADKVKEILIRPQPCWMCPIACGRMVKIETKWGQLEMDGPEYETIYAIGGVAGVTNLAGLLYLNYLADDLGIDTISLGNVLGFAVEAYKRNKIDFDVDFGQVEAMAELAKKIAYREGIGDILADGVAKAAKKLGLEDIAIHVKGLEPAGYDPRRLKGMILGYASSPRGACHLRMMAYYVDLKKLGGEPEEVSERKVRTLIEFEDFMTAFDSMILCKFGRSIFTIDVMWEFYNAVTGANMSQKEFRRALERIRVLIQMINVNRGLTKEHETLPERFTKEKIEDPNGNSYGIDASEIDYMVSTYYQLRGFDKNGKPTREKINELGLDTL